jgi:ABC-2 type transport system permease protein
METQSLGRIRRVGLQTIIRREFGRIIRIWGQTLVPPAVTAALYFVIFGSLIGRRIGQMDGYDYTQYIAPGLIMMAVISNSYGNVVSSFFGAKFGKHIEELLVAPLPNWLIVVGYVSGGVMRGLLVGVVVTVVTLFFTSVPVEHPVLVIGSVLLTSVVFALGGLFNAIFAKNFDQISWFPTFVLTPLIYLGGVFYSVSLLPDWAEQMSYVNPILYMVNSFRHGFLGTSDVNPGFAFLIMAAFALVMFAVVVTLMNRGTGIRE